MHFASIKHQKGNLEMPINAFNISNAEVCVSNMKLGYNAFDNGKVAYIPHKF